MPVRLAAFAFVAGLVVLLDQASKAWVLDSFRLYESRPVIEGWFHFTYVRNPGAAFGLFAGSAEAFRRLPKNRSPTNLDGWPARGIVLPFSHMDQQARNRPASRPTHQDST